MSVAAAACVSALYVPASAGAAKLVGTGTHPWVVVLCNFSDQPAQPNSQAYYQDLFSDPGAGKLGLLDYWRDTSFGQLSIAGTTVTPWVVAKDPADTSKSLTRGQWINLTAPFNRGGGDARLDKIIACADGADGIDFNKYWGVTAIFPETRSTLAAPIGAGDTTVTLTTTQYFPNGSSPFSMAIDSETVNVTGINGNTLTIARGQGGSTAAAHGTGAAANIPGDLGGVGAGQLTGIPIKGADRTIATIVLPHQVDVTGASHEMGHGHGYSHSRSFSDSTNDYGDPYDEMSQYWCPGPHFSANSGAGLFYDPLGGSDFGGPGPLYNYVLCRSDINFKGPGLDAINLDTQGWIPTPRHFAFDNSTSNQATIALHSLGDPNARNAPGSDYLEARVPAAITVPVTHGNPATVGNTTSDYYTVEYRQKEGWDRGFPDDSVMMHLHAPNQYEDNYNYSYWMDKTPGGAAYGHGGLMYVGDEYVDAANKTYAAVNAKNTGAHTATVTLGSRKINATVTRTGADTGDFNDAVTLAATLKVAGSGAPVPGQPLALSVGTDSCAAVSDPSGAATCEVTLSQHPGSYTETASFPGDDAYASASGSGTFTITKEESQVSYDGALTEDYHDAFTASATLTDPNGGAPIAGKTVTFSIGSSDSCSSATDASGVASCSITPTQAAGTVNMVASFAGDTDYVSSGDTQSFVIKKEETTTAYTGVTVILQGASGVTLKGQLLEDGSTATPIAGRTLTLGLGGQSCTGTTGANGVASCSLIFTGALGSQPLVASFAGDAYYLSSSDASKSAIVFAFPTRGAFVLGDNTVATASTTSPPPTVTWWSDNWSTLNSLSGGPASDSFKGFARTVSLPTSTPPSACGSAWKTKGGDSPPPTSGVPSYMGTLVTSRVTKSGSTIAGDTVKIVVVRTDPGYAPNPFSAGTGTIVATYCP